MKVALWCVTKRRKMGDAWPNGRETPTSMTVRLQESRYSIQAEKQVEATHTHWSLACECHIHSKLVVYAVLKLASTMSWMCVDVCVGSGNRRRYLGGGFYRSLPVEGEIKVCCCLCVPEMQQGGDRHFLCLLWTTENTGKRGVRVKKERGG